MEISAITYRFLGARQDVEVKGLGEPTSVEHYLLGADPKLWQPWVRAYSSALYEGLLPGVDMRLYEHEGKIEYDLMLSEDADLASVRIRCEPATELAIGALGELIVKTPARDFRHGAPSAFLIDSTGRKKRIESSIVVLSKNEFGFRAPDRGKGDRLLLDPALVYGKYLAGASDDVANSVAVDRDGNAYVTGFTNSIGFPTAPTTPSPFDPTHNGGRDIFVCKINPTGTRLVWSTFLGGTADDWGTAITVEPSGLAYVTGAAGITSPGTFPVIPNSQVGQSQSGGGATDAFIAGFDANGLLPPVSTNGWITYLGIGGDDAGYGIALDSASPLNVYVTGKIAQPPSGQPTSPPFTPSSVLGGLSNPVLGTLQSLNQGYLPPTTAIGTTDAFVAKLRAGAAALGYIPGTFDYFTYHGGAQNEVGYGIAFMGNETVYITGEVDVASGLSFVPVAPQYACLQPSPGGVPTDAFLTGFQSASNGAWLSLVYNSWLGGQFEDKGFALTAESNGAIYVAGRTVSPNFPVTAGASDTVFGGGYSQFPPLPYHYDGYLWKGVGFLPGAPGTAPPAQPAIAPSVAFSTFLGGSLQDEATAVFLHNGTPMVVGHCRSADFPVIYPPVVLGCVGCPTIPNDNITSLFILKLNSAGTSLVLTAFEGNFGGTTNITEGLGGAIDANAGVYVVGRTECDISVTSGTFGTSHGSTPFVGNFDGFIQKWFF